MKDVNRASSKPKKILLIASNPAVSTTSGWPVGFWASELIHPYFEFTDAGYDVEIRSPSGGKLELDGYSDPRHASGYSKHDILSLGFLSSAEHIALLEDTKSIDGVRVADFDAIVVAGGQGPLFTFPTATKLHELFVQFYEAGKVSAALCHGTALLLYTKLSDGEYLIKGKTMTGFANVEEDFSDSVAGTKMAPFRIEDEAKARGANFIQAGKFREFATRDGNLVTGQQQYSGKAVAKLVIEALGA